LPTTLLTLALILLSALPALAGEIVILHSESGPTPWTQKIATGLADGLDDGTRIIQEFIGSGTLDEDHFNAEYERLADVHTDTTPEAVIASGQTAFAFMRKYRDDLFSAAPVVFCSMPRPGPKLLNQCGDCTGIPLEMDVRDTVDLIFAVRPNTKTVVGIMDASSAGQTLRKATEAAMEPYMDRAQLIFPGHEPGDETGLDMGKLNAVASSVPGSGAVLFLGFKEDKAGKAFNEKLAVGRLVVQSVAPIFVLTDTWLGDGVLGGMVATGEAQGQSAAGLIKRIRRGDPSQEMLPQPTPPQLIADATVLARFGIRPERIPLLSKAKLINQPEHPSEQSSATPSNVIRLTLLLVGLALLPILFRKFGSRKRKPPE